MRERSPRACPSPSFPFPFFFFFCLREMEKGFLESEYERDSPGCLGVLVTLGKVSPRRTWSPAFPQVTPSFGRVYTFWVCFDLTAGFRDRAAGIDSSVVRGKKRTKEKQINSKSWRRSLTKSWVASSVVLIVGARVLAGVISLSLSFYLSVCLFRLAVALARRGNWPIPRRKRIIDAKPHRRASKQDMQN